MTITKPLMFLWGQTPAFDSVVRARMSSFNLKGFQNTRWGFNLWISVMKKLQRYLNHNTELIISFRKMSIEKYGTDKIVPYGQFFDLYYWTEDKQDNGSKNKDTFRIEEKQIMDFEKNEATGRVRKSNKFTEKIEKNW